MNILILGASGMLGNVLFSYLSKQQSLNVYGTCYKNNQFYRDDKKIFSNVDVNDSVLLHSIFSEVKPNIIVNCVGVIKQKDANQNINNTLLLNGVFPHNLYKICTLYNSRLIHISTDCVFNGSKGNYKEEDSSDAVDLYGISKYLGEIHYEKSVTLRTSIIGHELDSNFGLLNWFLSQKGIIKGFTRAFFSGLTTLELSKIIWKIVIPSKNLSGLYHVAGNSLSKYDLLKKINYIYNCNVLIEEDDSFIIDRSLNAEKFNSLTGYSPPDWNKLITDLKNFNLKKN